MFAKTRRTALAAALLLAFATAAQAEILYTVTDLGANLSTHGINNLGHVSGWSTAGQGFFWDGAMHFFAATTVGRPNDLGQVAIYGGYWDGSVHNISGFNGGDINNSGLLAGTSNADVAVYDLGTGLMTNLGRLPGDTVAYAYAINASGQVAGWSLQASTGVTRGFVHTPGSGMLDLGFLPGGNYTYPRDMNDSGQVVGYARRADNSVCAFSYSAGSGITELPTLTGYELMSEAHGIDSAGQIVGSAQTSSGDRAAFLYSGGTMTNLNDLIDPSLRVNLTYGRGINDNGQIAAIGLVGTVQHGYLLTPISVPEPSTMVLLAGGFAALAIYALRKRRG